MNRHLFFIVMLLYSFTNLFSQNMENTNVPGELNGVFNSQLFYEYHPNIDFETEPKDAFLPYLSYLDPYSKKPTDHLMDSIVIMNKNCEAPTNVMRTDAYEFMFDNWFVQARNPQIVLENEYALLNTGVQKNIIIDSTKTDRVYSLSLNTKKTSSEAAVLYIGMEFFDENGTEITSGNLGGNFHYFSTYYDWWHIQFEPTEEWTTTTYSVLPIPDTAKSMNLIITKSYGPDILIDDIVLKDNDQTSNLVRNPDFNDIQKNMFKNYACIPGLATAPGALYTLSYKIKTEALKTLDHTPKGLLDVYVNYLNVSGVDVNQTNTEWWKHVSYVSDQWTEVSYVISTPPGGTYLSITFDANGSLPGYTDDVLIKDITLKSTTKDILYESSFVGKRVYEDWGENALVVPLEEKNDTNHVLADLGILRDIPITVPINQPASTAENEIYEYTLTFRAKKLSSKTAEFYAQFEFFDADGNEIIGGFETDEKGELIKIDGKPVEINPAGYNMKFSPYLDSYFYAYSDIGTYQSWTPYSFNISCPPDAASFNVFLRKRVGDTIYFDDIKITSNTGGQEIIADEDFENSASVEWENYLARNNNLYFFDTRTSMVDAIAEAQKEIEQELGNTQTIKLIFPMPVPNFYTPTSPYTDPAFMNRFYEFINRYLAKLNSSYIEWQEKWRLANNNNNADVEIAGIYYSQETLEGTAVSPNIKETYKLYLSYLQTRLHDYGWKLFASPYRKSYRLNDHYSSKYPEEFHPYFDALWLQPNAFYFNYTKNDATVPGYIDSDILYNVNEYASNERLGVNIEVTVDSSNPYSEDNRNGYSLVMDYFKYGYKYGYVNYTKCYYDSGGIQFKAAHSTDPKDREKYDALYRFIKSSQTSFVVNGNFESMDRKWKDGEINIFELKTNTNGGYQVYGWEGDYSVHENTDAMENSYRQGFNSLKTAPAQSISTFGNHKIPVRNGEWYTIICDYRTLTGNGSGKIGLIFYDDQGEIVEPDAFDLGGAGWQQEFLNSQKAYFTQISATTAWTDQDKFLVQIPDTAVSVQIVIKNPGNTVILWDNVDLQPENEPIISTSIWSQAEPIGLVRDSYQNLAVTKELINVFGNSNVIFKTRIKENHTNTEPYNAAFYIEVFDKNGKEIVGEPVSDPAKEIEGDVPGLVWSPSDVWHGWYYYITVDTLSQDILTTNGDKKDIDAWTNWEKGFSLPENADSFRGYVRINSNDPDCFIDIQNPRFEIETKVTDSFGRADSSLDLGSTESPVPGYVWKRVRNGSAENTPGISSNSLRWLYSSQGTNAVYLENVPAIKDFKLDFDYTRFSNYVSTHSMVVYFRLTGPESYIPDGDSIPGYQLIWYPTASDKMQFILKDDYNTTPLATGEAALSQNYQAHVTLIAQGNKLQILADGKEVIHFTDTTANSAKDSPGYIQFLGNQWISHSIDNLELEILN